MKVDPQSVENYKELQTLLVERNFKISKEEGVSIADDTVYLGELISDKGIDLNLTYYQGKAIISTQNIGYKTQVLRNYKYEHSIIIENFVDNGEILDAFLNYLNTLITKNILIKSHV